MEIESKVVIVDAVHVTFHLFTNKDTQVEIGVCPTVAVICHSNTLFRDRDMRFFDRTK